MNRITLDRLEVTDGDLAPAVLTFEQGLNVISGPEDRGKTYAFHCLDYLFGSKTRPKEDVPESEGYSSAWLYFHTDDIRYCGIRRRFDKAECFISPFRNLDEDIAPPAKWTKLSVTHSAKSESISSFWLRLFGIPATKLRRNATGGIGSMSLRHAIHMVLVDEGRMASDDSPMLGDRGFGDTLYRDAFAFNIGARLNPPVEPNAVKEVAPVSNARNAVILEMLESIEASINAISADSSLTPEAARTLSSQIEEYRTAVSNISAQLSGMIGRRETVQRTLVSARSAIIARSELRSRLQLLANYYHSDLRRLDAIAEANHYLGQLDNVKCPTCDQYWAHHGGEANGLDPVQISEGCRKEAQKIRYLSRDLERELEIVESEIATLGAQARTAESDLGSLADNFTRLELQLSEANGQLNGVLERVPSLANRMALEQQREWLRSQIPAQENVEVVEIVSDRTVFAPQPIEDLCGIVASLLESWQWHYTTGKIAVEFDEQAMDLRISGRLRSSFGKAVRGLVTSALSLAIMEYCLDHEMPHPGFTVLDSPLTAHGGQNKKGQTDRISMAVQNAFFEEIARKYSKNQVIVFDNKVPPVSLEKRINHIRFGSGAHTRAGFFP